MNPEWQTIVAAILVGQILPLLQSYAVFLTGNQGFATLHPRLSSHAPSALKTPV